MDERPLPRARFRLTFHTCGTIVKRTGRSSIIDNQSDLSAANAPLCPGKVLMEDSKSRPLERRVFREEIREQLIEAILNGRLAPGARIVETRIAQQFGVSQGPVREALRDLELFGFVVSSPFRGTQVRKISTEELLEIYPLRAAIEGVAARAAAPRIDEATLTHLEQLIDQMREAAARDDHSAEADADHNFHHAIVKASGNRMLEHIWQTMRLSITTCLTHSITHRSLHEIAERHVVVVEALRSRDPDRAEAAIRRHIEEPGEWILSAHRATQDTTDGEADTKEAAV
jgi:DNA-binding GntR family transcriptional regulator